MSTCPGKRFSCGWISTSPLTTLGHHRRPPHHRSPSVDQVGSRSWRSGDFDEPPRSTEGKDPAADAKYSLKPVADRLKTLLPNDIVFATDTVGRTPPPRWPR